jgi:hypothetical protein
MKVIQHDIPDLMLQYMSEIANIISIYYDKASDLLEK